MTPEELKKLNELATKLDLVYNEFVRMNYPDKFILRKELVLNGKFTLSNTSSIDFSSVSQLKLGGAASTIGFYGATPVVRAGAITPPSGGATVDAQARTAINSIISALQAIGITS